jgi:hypothetical protein
VRQTFDKPDAQCKDEYDWNGTRELFDVDSTDGCHRDNGVGFQVDHSCAIVWKRSGFSAGKRFSK